MACNNRVNFIAPQYPESCVCPACPAYPPQYMPCSPKWRCRPHFRCDNMFCGTPCNFIFPDCEQMADLHTTIQNKILCATCVYPLDGALTIMGAGTISRIEEMSEEGSISLWYAGGEIKLAGIVDELPTSPEAPLGTRRIFLTVPLVLSYTPLSSGMLSFMQVNATYTALLMPDQCPEITTTMPNIDVVVKAESTNSLRILSYTINMAEDTVMLELDYSQSMLSLYFIKKQDKDICVLPSSMPKLSCTENGMM